jgi:glyoxylase-like metal-dependent hydrolase (beta-lactamase superfamily II)
MKHLSLLILAALQCTLVAQRDFSAVEIKATEVTENIHMLEGSGGNIALFEGEDGALIIDTQFAPLTEKIKAAISELTEHELKYVLNTHWHGDHTGGNENFGNDGAIIVSHENVLERLSKDQIMKAFNREVKASPKAAWPQITFKETMQLHLNGEPLQMIHVHNAHTDGDAFVYFPESNVIHLGDCFFAGRFPFIDLGSGGSVDGAINAIQVALMLTNSSTKIIPGHGSLSKKSDLLSYYTMLQTMKGRVLSAMEEGKSLEEMKAGNLGEGYEEWGSGFINLERFLDIIWTDYNREEE